MEREFLQWLQQRSSRDPRLLIGLGDDGAVVKSTAGPLILTTDTIAEGTHFEFPLATREQVGWKALAVSLSDIAAMGGRPKWALVNLQLPGAWTLEDTCQLHAGIQRCAEKFDVAIVGGDTNRWSGPLVVVTTIIGEPLTADHWPMSACQPGDALVVTGPLGGSILGHHLQFSPRCDWARRLATRHQIHAATDITDSLTVDLQLMCDASRCGVDLFVDRIPLTRAAHQRAGETGWSPLEHALYDGEDFELLLAVPARGVSDLMADPYWQGSLQIIGAFTSELGIRAITENGQSRPLLARGYEH